MKLGRLGKLGWQTNILLYLMIAKYCVKHA